VHDAHLSEIIEYPRFLPLKRYVAISNGCILFLSGFRASPGDENPYATFHKRALP